MERRIRKFRICFAAFILAVLMAAGNCTCFAGTVTAVLKETAETQEAVTSGNGEGGFVRLSRKKKKKKNKNNNNQNSTAATADKGGSEAKNNGKGTESASSGSDVQIEEDGTYTSKDEVALYIHTYGKLPSNYITKKEAEDLGWKSYEGNLWEVAPGKSIGGSRFGNYEGLLPEAKGRKYYECDIDFDGGRRNAKRIVYSNDGLVFYTDDHYNTFEQLY